MTSPTAAPKFAAWVRNRMFKKGIGYANVAISTGLHPTAVSDICRKDRDVRLSTFIALCKGLDADPVKVLREILK